MRPPEWGPTPRIDRAVHVEPASSAQTTHGLLSRSGIIPCAQHRQGEMGERLRRGGGARVMTGVDPPTPPTRKAKEGLQALHEEPAARTALERRAHRPSPADFLAATPTSTGWSYRLAGCASGGRVVGTSCFYGAKWLLDSERRALHRRAVSRFTRKIGYLAATTGLRKYRRLAEMIYSGGQPVQRHARHGAHPNPRPLELVQAELESGTLTDYRYTRCMIRLPMVRRVSRDVRGQHSTRCLSYRVAQAGPHRPPRPAPAVTARRRRSRSGRTRGDDIRQTSPAFRMISSSRTGFTRRQHCRSAVVLGASFTEYELVSLRVQLRAGSPGGRRPIHSRRRCREKVIRSCR